MTKIVWYAAVIFLNGLAGIASGTPTTNANASISGTGSSCSATANYNFGGGGFGGTAGPNSFLCSYTVSPSSPGATAVQLRAGELGSTSASNSFDLSRGTITGSIFSAPGHGGGRATDTIRDTVFFTNSNPGPVPLGIDWRIDGIVSLDTLSPGSCCFSISFQGVFGGVVDYTFDEDVNNGITANQTQVSGYDSFSTQAPAAGHVGSMVDALYTIAPGDSQLTFQMSLDMAGGYGSADFGHTFQIALQLPQGVTYTSDSGVFLTAPATPPGSTSVPEPATLALCSLALAAVALGRSLSRVRPV